MSPLYHQLGRLKQSGMIHRSEGLKTREPVCDPYKVLTMPEASGKSEMELRALRSRNSSDQMNILLNFL